MAEAMKDGVSKMLKGIDRYNPENLVPLEKYVEAQVRDNYYDLEANLAVLKLYQFNPTYFQTKVVEDVLLKALTNLPHTDFVLCKCLIDPTYAEEEPIKRLVYLHNLLETCRFTEFWTLLSQHKELAEKVIGFEDAIREYVCHVISITYQLIEKATLKELMGGNLSDNQLAVLMQKKGWKEAEFGRVFVANQEENIKTRNITEKIDFENVATVLSTYR